jgi:hypothetical protein
VCFWLTQPISKTGGQALVIEQPSQRRVGQGLGVLPARLLRGLG